MFGLFPRMGTTKPNAVKRCTRCNGKGFVIQTSVMMGMVTQTRNVCPECGGEGSSISSKDRCKTCRGRKIRREREEMSVTVRPGMSHGQKIVLRGAADQDPHLETGDIVFYIDQITHPFFRRRGDDLFVRQNVSLLQALTGAAVTIDHLNGEKVKLVTKRGDVLAPGAVRCVDRLGMPVYGQEGKFGKLFVQFQVKFPSGLTEEQMQKLQSVLGEKKEEKSEEESKKDEKPKEEEESKKEEKPKEEEESKKDEKPKEEEKPNEEESKKDEKPKEEEKKEEKTEETKVEEQRDEKKDEEKKQEETVEYILKQCDQDLYANSRLWDVQPLFVFHFVGTLSVVLLLFVLLKHDMLQDCLLKKNPAKHDWVGRENKHNYPNQTVTHVSHSTHFRRSRLLSMSSLHFEHTGFYEPSNKGCCLKYSFTTGGFTKCLRSVLKFGKISFPSTFNIAHLPYHTRPSTHSHKYNPKSRSHCTLPPQRHVSLEPA